MPRPVTRSRARRPPHEPLAEWERDLLEGEKKADDAEVQTSAETEKVADAEAADAAEVVAEAVAEAPAAEAPAAEAEAEAPAADAEQA